jgi:hypothetical protein
MKTAEAHNMPLTGVSYLIKGKQGNTLISKDFIKDRFEMFCKILRDEALRKPYRSEKYKKWVREQMGGSTFHHVMQAVYGMKASDLLGVALLPEIHSLQQDEKISVENMVKAVVNLMRYVEYLEKKNDRA